MAEQIRQHCKGREHKCVSDWTNSMKGPSDGCSDTFSMRQGILRPCRPLSNMAYPGSTCLVQCLHHWLVWGTALETCIDSISPPLQQQEQQEEAVSNASATWIL